MYSITVGVSPRHYTVDPMLLPSGNPFKCHEEVLYLQPMIPPKRFDIFPPDWGMLRRSDAFRFFFKHMTLSFGRRADNYCRGRQPQNVDAKIVFLRPKRPWWELDPCVGLGQGFSRDVDIFLGHFWRIRGAAVDIYASLLSI